MLGISGSPNSLFKAFNREPVIFLYVMTHRKAGAAPFTHGAFDHNLIVEFASAKELGADIDDRQPDNPDFVGYTAMLTRTPVDGYVGTCAALRDADLTESTRALKMPALCIVGDQDGATPPDLVRSMADLICNSEFRIIPDAGHLPCIEQPDAVAGLIGTFLRNARYG